MTMTARRGEGRGFSSCLLFTWRNMAEWTYLVIFVAAVVGVMTNVVVDAAHKELDDSLSSSSPRSPVQEPALEQFCDDEDAVGTCVPPKPSSLLPSDKCTIYLAPSTIPHAGLGIFTTLPKKKGDTIGWGDVFLPLMELDWHNSIPGQRRRSYSYFQPFHDYVWSGDVMGMGQEVESEDIEAMCPGLDAAINCNLALINVGKATPQWDDGGLHRSKDPGAGALTPYHNGTTPILYRNVPAGGELFKFYGDSWFETRPDIFRLLPLTEDYPKAQHLLDIFGKLIGVKKQPSSEEAAITGQNDALLANITASPMRLAVEWQRDLWNIVANFPFESRVMSALPKQLEDAWIAAADEIAAFHQPNAIRSEEWLEQNGKCFDHIRPGHSKLPQAGRGAFAVRPLSAGTIITGTPLLHVTHYKTLQMFAFQQNEAGKWVKQQDNMIGYQVALNYGYGHEDSTMVLVPYGAGVSYINHNQTLANVKIRWSQPNVTGHNATWLTMTPSEIEWNYKPSLAFDYVALRDIRVGEELYMDYGDTFERAWQDHVKNWRPLPGSKFYASAHDWNMRMATTPLRTEREQEYDPYPQNLEVRCHSALVHPHWRQRLSQIPKQVHLWKLHEKGHLCKILDRYADEDGYDLYDVHVYESAEEAAASYDDDGLPTAQSATQYLRSAVPRHVIFFVDVPYSTDMHLRNAFRHPIMIPDDMIPIAWRNDEKDTIRGGKKYWGPVQEDNDDDNDDADE